MTGYQVAIDIGGTFTDLVALSENNEKILNIKIPSTPKEPAKAVIRAFQEFLKRAENEQVSVVVHATTIATNALLGQLNLELPKVAIITTSGFRDIIGIGRQHRHELYDLFMQKPRTLVPRRLRFEVEERIGPEGQVLTPLNIAQVKNLAEQLKKANVRSVAVALLFSHINRCHENEIGRMLKRSLPNIYISLSSEVAPEYKEYERTSTTVVNAVLKPIISSYLHRLHGEIGRLEVKAPLCVMQSDGGVATKNIVTEKPVSMIESGPAAGVIASAFYSKLLGIENLLSLDMGGTTAKAGAVRRATPQIVNEYEVAGKIHKGRFVKGSGYPIKHPFIDLAECSAGGGTIAWIDEGKALRVGPLSTGAEPGPACYGAGGKQPTVTDANVVLGRLNPRRMLGGKLKIYRKLSEKAILKEICGKTQLQLIEAAAGIIRITNSEMAKILSIVSLERGYDPRDFFLMCFGGAGPMHGCALAEELRIGKIIVPEKPGLLSAYGLLTADRRSSLTRALMKPIDKVEANKVEAVFQRLESEAAKILKSQLVPKKNMSFIRQIDLRYLGQSYELTTPTFKPLTEKALCQTVQDFHKKHMSVYGYAVKNEPVELVNIRLTAVGLVKKPKLKEKPIHQKKPSRNSMIERREVFFDSNDGYINTPIFERDKLKTGNIIEGPAIIEQYDATTVVYPEWLASIDRFGNLILSMRKVES